eukprot:1851950-Pyramimonas_sp.AAC.1
MNLDVGEPAPAGLPPLLRPRLASTRLHLKDGRTDDALSQHGKTENPCYPSRWVNPGVGKPTPVGP